MIYLDIDYMEDFKDFTVNKERFPDLKGLAKEMKERGIRLIPIIDAAVRHRPRTAVAVLAVLCISQARRTIAVLSQNTIRAEPSDEIALMTSDLSLAVFITSV